MPARTLSGGEPITVDFTEKRGGPRWTRAFRQMIASSGVVDMTVVVFDPDSVPRRPLRSRRWWEDDRYRVSRAAAMAAMDIFGQRHDERLRRKHPDVGAAQWARLFHIHVANEPVGKPISLDTFFGPWFDMRRRQLIIDGGFANDPPTARARDEATAHVQYWLRARGLEATEEHNPGLTGALLYQPSGPCFGALPAQVFNRIFCEFVEQILYDAQRPLTIFEWSDDWSNYFDAGKEWWGTYFWTVLIEDLSEVVAIGASASE
ncbi:MAG: hypothetical protein KC620_06255 [Myxococcales bacterium]|nr:hypothetical protein [Myxococcales bacterium]